MAYWYPQNDASFYLEVTLEKRSNSKQLNLLFRYIKQSGPFTFFVSFFETFSLFLNFENKAPFRGFKICVS